MSDEPMERLLTEGELSRLIRRSLASLQRDRHLNQGIPYVKLGFQVRYRPEDVRAYLESCKVGK